MSRESRRDKKINRYLDFKVLELYLRLDIYIIRI